MSASGHVEGQNIAIEYRWAEGQAARVPALARELLDRRAVVIAAVGGGVVQAVKSVTTVPIVFTFAGDPVEAGLVTSINRPTGNATGVVGLNYALDPKRLEILRELAKDALIAVMVNPSNPDRLGAERQVREVQAAARTLGAQIEILPAANAREIDLAFRTLERLRAGALLVSADPFYNSRREQLASLAAHYAIPALYHAREFALAGGLMSYGTNVAELYRQTGVYAGRLLSGAKPADLPVLFPTKFEFVINLQTARAMGLEIPAKLLALADEVIE